MTANANPHSPYIDAWIDHVTRNIPPEKWASVLGDGLNAVWLRASLTLSEITLLAILDRALYTSAQKFPILERMNLQNAENRLTLSMPDDRTTPAELREAIRHLLTQFLTVVGNITGDLLTPALHAELDQLSATEGAGTRKEGNHEQ